MIDFKVTKDASAHKYSQNLYPEGSININIDENNTKEIIFWGSDGFPMMFLCGNFPSLSYYIENGGNRAEELEEVPGKVDQNFVLELIKGIRIDSKKI